MKKKFWYSHSDDYGGPFSSAEEAMVAGADTAQPDAEIEIHQLIAVSPTPKRTWRKR